MDAPLFTPILTAPAEVQYFTGVRPGVTRVQPLSQGWTGLPMKSVGVHPSQSEMQNLLEVEISVLNLIEMHSKCMKRGGNHFPKFHRGGHK